MRSAARGAEEIPVPATPPDTAELLTAIAAIRNIVETEVAELRSQMRPNTRKVSFEDADEEGTTRRTRRGKRGE